MDQSANYTNEDNELQTQILNSSARFEVPSKTSLECAWELFVVKAENAELKIQLKFYTTFAFKLAASFTVILLASFTLYFSQNVEIETAPGQIKTAVLPDNSIVTLNAGSSIHYNALTFSYFRKVNFSGEGFFAVEKGSAFLVESVQGSTQVLGTKFNVLARNQKYEVACVEGKVKVNTKKTSVVLTSGLKTISFHQQLSLQPADEKSIAWQRGEFYFENEDIHNVIQTLELQYGITVKYTGDQNRKYTGYFTNKNLEEALQLVCLPLQLEYKLESDKEIIISTKH